MNAHGALVKGEINVNHFSFLLADERFLTD